MLRKSPFLDMTDLYNTPGTVNECIGKLAEHPESQLLFEAEIAYSRGEIDKVLESTKKLIDMNSGLYSTIASGMLLSLCAMWTGDVELWYKAKKHIYEAPCKNETKRDVINLTIAASDSAIRYTDDFPEWFKMGCFDNLPKDAHPAARVYYIKYLLIIAQEVALGHIEYEGIKGTTLIKLLPRIIEPMISQMVVDKVIMAEIYLRLLCAIAYNQSGDNLRGGAHLDRAIELCLADRLYGPLVEHRRQLGMFLDDHIAMIDTKALKTVKQMHKQLHEGWTVLHNEVVGNTVSAALTVREREIARLAAFGLTDAQISRQLGISESSVKVIIRSAKTKANVDKRKELALYI